MKSLVVRDLDDSLVDALPVRAIANGRSAEDEHREILAEVLGRPRRRTFANVLASMPNVGRAEDFERLSTDQAAPNVFR